MYELLRWWDRCWCKFGSSTDNSIESKWCVGELFVTVLLLTPPTPTITTLASNHHLHHIKSKTLATFDFHHLHQESHSHRIIGESRKNTINSKHCLLITISTCQYHLLSLLKPQKSDLERPQLEEPWPMPILAPYKLWESHFKHQKWDSRSLAAFYFSPAASSSHLVGGAWEMMGNGESPPQTYGSVSMIITVMMMTIFKAATMTSH